MACRSPSSATAACGLGQSAAPPCDGARRAPTPPTTGSPNISARSDIAITADIPLASRCLEKGARVLAPTASPSPKPDRHGAGHARTQPSPARSHGRRPDPSCGLFQTGPLAISGRTGKLHPGLETRRLGRCPTARKSQIFGLTLENHLPGCRASSTPGCRRSRWANVPCLLHANAKAAALIGLDPSAFADPDFVRVFSGHMPLGDFSPLAMVYSGHQFGAWAGQLGDGRALLIGQVAQSEAANCGTCS